MRIGEDNVRQHIGLICMTLGGIGAVDFSCGNGELRGDDGEGLHGRGCTAQYLWGLLVGEANLLRHTDGVGPSEHGGFVVGEHLHVARIREWVAVIVVAAISGILAAGRRGLGLGCLPGGFGQAPQDQMSRRDDSGGHYNVGSFQALLWRRDV